MTKDTKLREEIYKILFDQSRVDGLRLINEDEWPVDQLEALILKREREAKIELIKELQSRWVTPSGDLYEHIHRISNLMKDELLSLEDQGEEGKNG